MDDPKFELRAIENPIAFCVSISKDRRIRLPKFLVIPPPYVLIEKEQGHQAWLGICAADFLAKLTGECKSLRILAEYQTCRPTLPKAVFDKHGMSEKGPIWLVSTGNWIEFVPESAWQVNAPEFS